MMSQDWVMATQVGLNVTTRIFDAMGAGATMGELGFDRFWRNLRTLSLHNPMSYTLKDLGSWALRQETPKPGFYS
jgi:alkylation response protein AidB-like acyl-CoA dehydrogenase